MTARPSRGPGQKWLKSASLPGARSKDPSGSLEYFALSTSSDELIVVSWPVSDGAVAPTHPGVSLTESETSILARILLGDSNETIARARKRAVRTVANQIASIFRKFDVRS